MDRGIQKGILDGVTMVALGLFCCVGFSLVVVSGLLIVVASLVRAQALGA